MKTLNEDMLGLIGAYKIIKRLVLPFTKWQIFKDGIIDKDGNVQYDELRDNPQLKDKFSFYDKLMLGTKKIFVKFFNVKTLSIVLITKFLTENGVNSTTKDFILNSLITEHGIDMNESHSEIDIKKNYSLIEEELEKMMKV